MDKEDLAPLMPGKRNIQDILIELQSNYQVLREIQNRTDVTVTALSESVPALNAIVSALNEQYKAQQDTLLSITAHLKNNSEQIHRIDKELQKFSVQLGCFNTTQTETSDKQEELATACSIKQQELAEHMARVNEMQNGIDQLKDLIHQSSEKYQETDNLLQQCIADSQKLYTTGQMIRNIVLAVVGIAGFAATLQSLGFFSLF